MNTKMTLKELHEQVAATLKLDALPYMIERQIEGFIGKGWSGKEILDAVKYDMEVRKVNRDVEKYGIGWIIHVREEAAAFYQKKAREKKAGTYDPKNPQVDQQRLKTDARYAEQVAAMERWLANRDKNVIYCHKPQRRPADYFEKMGLGGMGKPKENLEPIDLDKLLDEIEVK